MLFTSARTAALRCPLCGRFGVHPFTVFDFSSGRILKLKCECGYHKMTISTRDYKEYSVQIPCLVCETTHHTQISREVLWGTEFHILRCPEHETEMGYIGRDSEVSDHIERHRNCDNSIANDEGFDDYFTSPDVMYQVLAHLHAISERGDLYCGCGQRNIDVEVFPERLELRCPSCKSVNVVYAETAEDLQAVVETQVVELIESGFTFIDATAYRRRIKKTPLDKTDHR